MADNTGIRLLGFKGFEASERFLHALDNDIWVARWGRTRVPVHRPEDLDADTAMRAQIEQPSPITVVSAHAGYFPGNRLAFCGHDDQPVVTIDSIGPLGATSMLLIDACYAPDLADGIKAHAQIQPGTLIVGLDAEPGEDQVTLGRDSVSAIATVIRELCYPDTADLGPQAASRAVDLANKQITARNNAERARGVTSKKAMRPLLFKREC